MKTVKQEEAISRSRFIECPVCKSHTLKLKRVVQVGRCKSCNESYSIVIVHVKSGRKMKPATSNIPKPSEAGLDSSKESTLPSWQVPSDTSLFGASSENYSGLADTGFNYGSSREDKKSQYESGE